MTQILSPFAVRFKHPWSQSPTWQPFWTHTEAQAIARATILYSSLDGTKPQIIKAVIVSRSEHNDQKASKTRGFSQKTPQNQ